MSCIGMHLALRATTNVASIACHPAFDLLAERAAQHTPRCQHPLPHGRRWLPLHTLGLAMDDAAAAQFRSPQRYGPRTAPLLTPLG